MAELSRTAQKYMVGTTVLICAMVGWALVTLHSQLTTTRETLHAITVRLTVLEAATAAGQVLAAAQAATAETRLREVEHHLQQVAGPHIEKEEK